MPKLTIIDDDETTIVSLYIPGPIDAPKATVAIIQALDELPKQPPPRRQRSDAGRPRAAQ